ncbi:MAG: hypothetical protein IPO88_05200 [Nannocystis sp.]|uniref:PilN domain-containing protein n=1 Tax=Nannocystis sp. TaxID=1962667 RepID=UPI002428CECD|nr:hypothetical protein [Nannocystis sp.]MBK9752897.1 hypothetical protein [Nannocystis sp.]
MIRINLLPQTARRRRRPRAGRELPVLALVLVSIALITAGALWSAATEAESDELRQQTASLKEETRAVRDSFDPGALVPRERALQAERAAQDQLKVGRRTPTALLVVLAEIVAAGDPAALPGESPFAGRARKGPLWLSELRELDARQWSLTASAADLPTLTGLLRRLRSSEHFAAVAPAEYVREDDRLTLRVTLSVR